MAWTWFISVDFQLFLLTPPLVALAVKYDDLSTNFNYRSKFSLRRLNQVYLSQVPTTGINGPHLSSMHVHWSNCCTRRCLWTFSHLPGITSVCVLSVMGSLFDDGLQMTILFSSPLNTTGSFNISYEYLYDKPWLGGINYIVGVMLAIVMFRIKPTGRFTWNFFVLTFGWTACILLAHTAIYGLHYGGLKTRRDMSVTERTVYAALARPAWALSVTWVNINPYIPSKHPETYDT